MAEQRLIDANALLEKRRSFYEPRELESIVPIASTCVAVDDIYRAPTIDAAPVVHARWEPIDGTGDGIYKLWRCSACKNGAIAGDETGPDIPYCFCCGAKMDGGTEK